MKIEINKLYNYLLEGVMKDRCCPMCNTNDWSYNKYDVAKIPCIEDGKEKNGFYPNLSFCCRNCGYTLLFNKVHLENKYKQSLQNSYYYCGYTNFEEDFK